jgi:hypothetical protein
VTLDELPERSVAEAQALPCLLGGQQLVVLDAEGS